VKLYKSQSPLTEVAANVTITFPATSWNTDTYAVDSFTSSSDIKEENVISCNTDGVCSTSILSGKFYFVTDKKKPDVNPTPNNTNNGTGTNNNVTNNNLTENVSSHGQLVLSVWIILVSIALVGI
jgi:hypothetical protein